MALTRVRNISSGPVSLPAPWRGLIEQGSFANLSATTEAIMAALGGSGQTQGVLQFEDISSSGEAPTIHNTGVPSINTTAGNIQPVGSQAAGSAETAAAADHVHAHGNQAGGGLHANAIAAGAAGFMSGADKTKLDAASGVSGIYGDGSDGAVAFADQGAAPSGTTKTDNTAGATIFQLDRDLFCTTFALAATVTLRQNGFRVYAKTSAQIDGALANGGLPGTAGGGGGPAGTTGGGTAAGADTVGAGAGNAGANGDPLTGGVGGAGGGSDALPTEAGGAAGTATFVAARGQLRTLPQAALGLLFGASGAAAALGGSGGGAGGASAGSTGGAGGGGGGVGVLVARTITVSATGSISATGGAGKAGVGAAAGGGGGGGGGVLLLVANSITNAGSIVAAGGAAGAAGAPPATVGAAGSAGLVIQLVQS